MFYKGHRHRCKGSLRIRIDLRKGYVKKPLRSAATCGILRETAPWIVIQDEGDMRDCLPPVKNTELPTVAIAAADRAALCSSFNTELSTTAT